jgi:hypothetical protein
MSVKRHWDLPYDSFGIGPHTSLCINSNTSIDLDSNDFRTLCLDVDRAHQFEEKLDPPSGMKYPSS